MVLTTPDFIILGIIVISVLIGVLRGFVKESVSLVTWVVAIVLAVMYSNALAAHLTFTKISLVRTLTAFTIIFVGTVFCGAILNFLIGGFVSKTPFSIPDKILGSIFGLLRGVVFVTILVLLGGLTSLPEEAWWSQSYGVTRFQVLAIWLKERLPDENAKAFHFPNEKGIETAKELHLPNIKSNELSKSQN